MPKLKTKSGAKKRFKVLKSGKVKASHAKRRHLLSHKSRKSKRSLVSPMIVPDNHLAAIKQMMPYG